MPAAQAQAGGPALTGQARGAGVARLALDALSDPLPELWAALERAEAMAAAVEAELPVVAYAPFGGLADPEPAEEVPPAVEPGAGSPAGGRRAPNGPEGERGERPRAGPGGAGPVYRLAHTLPPSPAVAGIALSGPPQPPVQAGGEADPIPGAGPYPGRPAPLPPPAAGRGPAERAPVSAPGASEGPARDLPRGLAEEAGLSEVGRLADEILGRKRPGRAGAPAAAPGPAAGRAAAGPSAPNPVQARGMPRTGQDADKPSAETTPAQSGLASSGLARLATLAARLAGGAGAPPPRAGVAGDAAPEPEASGSGHAPAGRAAVSGMAVAGNPLGMGGSGVSSQAGQPAPSLRAGVPLRPQEEAAPATGPEPRVALPADAVGTRLDAAGLAELVNEALVEQARRHGVDLS
jgi:hypothetical protein